MNTHTQFTFIPIRLKYSSVLNAVKSCTIYANIGKCVQEYKTSDRNEEKKTIYRLREFSYPIA